MAWPRITPLVQLSLLERNGQQRLLSQREALRDHISQYIDRRLGDREFTIDRMTPGAQLQQAAPWPTGVLGRLCGAAGSWF